MATFQQSLSDVKTPAVGAATGATSQPVVAGPAAQAINAVTGVINTVIPILEKQRGIEAFQGTQKAAFELIQQHDQGLINATTFRRQKKELAITHFSTFDRNPEEVNQALVSAFGANPVERQEKTEATFYESMLLAGSAIKPDGTEEEKFQAGIDLEQAKAEGLRLELLLNQTKAKTTVTDNEQISIAGKWIDTLAQPLSLLTTGIIDLSKDVQTKEDQARFFTTIHDSFNRVIGQFTNKALEGLRGLRDPAFNSGKERLKELKADFKAVINPEDGMLGVRSKVSFIELMGKQADWNIAQAAPLVNKLHKLIGSQALSVIVAHSVNGKIDLSSKVREELETLFTKEGTTAEEKKKAFSLLDVINLHKYPDDADKQMKSPEQRSEALSLAIDTLASSGINKNSTEAELNAYATNGVIIAKLSRSITTPKNIENLFVTIGSQGNINQLDILSKSSNPAIADKAGKVARQYMRFSMSVVREMMFEIRRGESVDGLTDPRRIRFDNDPGELNFKFEPKAPLGFEMGEGDPKDKTPEEALMIKNANTALNLISETIHLDPKFKGIKDSELRLLIIETFAAVSGKGNDILRPGQTFAKQKALSTKQKALTTAAESIIRPTKADIDKDKIGSVFKAKADEWEKRAEVARKKLTEMEIPKRSSGLPILKKNSNGQWTLNQPKQSKRPKQPNLPPTLYEPKPRI